MTKKCTHEKHQGKGSQDHSGSHIIISTRNFPKGATKWRCPQSFLRAPPIVSLFRLEVMVRTLSWVALTFADQWLSGWWLSPTPLKNMKVTWDDYPTYYGKINVPNNQPVLVLGADLQYAHVWVSLRFGGGLRHFGWFFFVQYKAVETSSFYSYTWAYHSINRVITYYNWLISGIGPWAMTVGFPLEYLDMDCQGRYWLHSLNHSNYLSNWLHVVFHPKQLKIHHQKKQNWWMVKKTRS